MNSYWSKYIVYNLNKTEWLDKLSPIYEVCNIYQKSVLANKLFYFNYTTRTSYKMLKIFKTKHFAHYRAEEGFAFKLRAS